MAVTNRCETEEGEQQEATGEAVPQQQGQTDTLWVRFGNGSSALFPGLTRGQCWILYRAGDYSPDPPLGWR